jgi:hypothetical protein
MPKSSRSACICSDLFTSAIEATEELFFLGVCYPVIGLDILSSRTARREGERQVCAEINENNFI